MTDAKEKKALLAYIKDVPEWQRALIYEQLAVQNRTSATLGTVSARYLLTDRLTRREGMSNMISHAASALGDALAALDRLTVLCDSLPQDLRHDAEFAYEISYARLKELCVRHGYKE